MMENRFASRWYYAQQEDAEHWFGAKDNREEAIEAGRAQFDGDPFFVCCGTPMKHDLEVFDEDLDGAVSAFQNRNEDMFGEDGQGDPENDWTDAQRRELANRLNETFAQWAREHGFDKAYMLDCEPSEEISASPSPTNPLNPEMG